MEETVLTDRKKIIEWWLANPVLPGSWPHSFPSFTGLDHVYTDKH